MEKVKREIITTKKFIEMGKKIHGDKFDYSEVEYVNNKTKVKLTCDRGHKIEMSYQSHIDKKAGCGICAKEKIGLDFRTKAKESFIQKSIEKHGNKYNYEKVNYVDSHTKIIIICDNGHEFEQQPTRHLAGQGCKFCNQIALKEGKPITNVEVDRITNKWTKEKFIERAREIHNDEYDYSLVNFISYKKKVTIKCRKGHIFDQKVSSHLTGKKCKQCSVNNYTNEEFIEKSKEIFGNIFDYSKCKYEGAKTKVILICNKNKHEFEVEPSHHYDNLGCPLCYNTTEGKMEKELRKIYSEDLKIQFKIKKNKEIKTYPFDFIIKKHKVIVELDGRQHFENVDFFKQDVKDRQLTDFTKMYWAEKEGYTIIRIYQPDVYLDKYDWINDLCNNIKHYDNPKLICLAKDPSVYDEYCDNYKKFLQNI